MRELPASVGSRSVGIHWSASHLPASSRNNLAVSQWSSDAYRPSEARAAWLDHFTRRFGDIAPDNTPAQRPFRLRMESFRLGSMGVSFVETLWSRFGRLSPGTQDAYWLFQPRAGATLCRTPRGEYLVRPGDCFLFDFADPFALECNELSAGVSLTLPKQWLARWVARPERCSPLFPRTGEWSAALCSVVASLHPDSMGRLALPAAMVAENVAVLLALAAGPEAQARCLPLLESLRSTLSDSLHQPGLSTARVARLHHISLRTLHYTFANGGTTFLQELLRLRLERAQQILGDERLSGLEIAEVADRCGFADPSHFARRFRQRFAQTPVQYRRAVRTRTS